MVAKSPAERISSLRQRHKDAGRTEVRNVFAPPSLHAAIRKAAAALVKRQAKAPEK